MSPAKSVDVLVERLAAELHLTPATVREVLTGARFPALVEALSGLLTATEPYVEDAAPGEELNGLWADRFSRLSTARLSADAAAGGVRVSGGVEPAIPDQELRERAARALHRASPSQLDLSWDDTPSDYRQAYFEGADAVLMELGLFGAGHPERDPNLTVVPGLLAAVDGETTTKGSK